MVRSIGELNKEGRQHAADILLGSITEIKIEEGEGSQSSSALVLDVLDYC
jgi:hypothetical protein